jgi:hypothetical protein
MRESSRLFFEWPKWITRAETFVQILREKGPETEALILRGMDELVQKQRAFVLKICANEDAVAQRYAGGSRWAKLETRGDFSEGWWKPRRNRFHQQDPHAFGIRDPYATGIGHLLCIKRDAFAQDCALMFSHPGGRERQRRLREKTSHNRAYRIRAFCPRVCNPATGR